MAHVFICGGSKTGKTTLANDLCDSLYNIIHTDEYIGKGTWADIPDLIIKDLQKSGDNFICEGIQTARVLRRILKDPKKYQIEIDRVWNLTIPFSPVEPKALAMNKGLNTIFKEIQPLLNKKNIPIFYSVVKRVEPDKE
jgi:hypothetical protein